MGLISKKDLEKIQVSSVVRNDKSFGKQNIFDGRDDTCWSSDEGNIQWILMEFKEPQIISSFEMQFQGGFVGKNCQAEFSNDNKTFKMPFYPEDINSVQNFSLPEPVNSKIVKFLFEGSTDFFGREFWPESIKVREEVNLPEEQRSSCKWRDRGAYLNSLKKEVTTCLIGNIYNRVQQKRLEGTRGVVCDIGLRYFVNENAVSVSVDSVVSS